MKYGTILMVEGHALFSFCSKPSRWLNVTNLSVYYKLPLFPLSLFAAPLTKKGILALVIVAVALVIAAFIFLFVYCICKKKRTKNQKVRFLYLTHVSR